MVKKAQGQAVLEGAKLVLALKGKEQPSESSICIRRGPACRPRGFLHSGQFIFIVRSPSTRRSSLLQVLGDDRQTVEALERIKAVRARESHDPVCPHSYGLLHPSVCIGLIFVQKAEQAAYLGKPL